MKITVRVPATVANLGPGFDCLALALELFNEVTVDTDAEPGVEIEGEGAGDLPSDSSNLIVRSMNEAAEKIGRPLPPLAIRSVNRIPVERGLGSSAAAVVSGLVLTHSLLFVNGELPETWSSWALLDQAADLEGHADNVAAALWGGLTLAYGSEWGWRAERLEPHADLGPVLYVPDHRTSTAEARRALPPSVSFSDAAFTAGRTALLVQALTNRPEILGIAMQDRLHEDARLALAPASRALVDLLRAQHFPACVAGSGPSILAFDQPNHHHHGFEPGRGWREFRVPWSPRGAHVRGPGISIG